MFIGGFMKVILPEVELLDEVDYKIVCEKLEKIGRVCYKSEDKISSMTAEKFLKNIIKCGHESVLEHEKVTMKIICDRGVTHEIVRHRIASYSQESTRYCNYSLDKFNNEITFIKPCFWVEKNEILNMWEQQMLNIEKTYFKLLEMGARPEEARSVLPNSLKTELVMTMNIREWRHFIKLRNSNAAHPQMREIAKMILNLLYEKLPLFFEDLL